MNYFRKLTLPQLGSSMLLAAAAATAGCTAVSREQPAFDPIPFRRTPDSMFVGLPSYGFEPNYAEVRGNLRVHYVDGGPPDAGVIVLLHGEPSWSFLYRKMIPLLTAAGHRVIAPDLVGFGRSDKPIEQSAHTYARHVEWMSELLFGHLDLTQITLFAQDWGGLIGLRLVADNPERFARVAIANTGLPNRRSTAWRRLHGLATGLTDDAGVQLRCDRSAGHEVSAL